MLHHLPFMVEVSRIKRYKDSIYDSLLVDIKSLTPGDWLNFNQIAKHYLSCLSFEHDPHASNS